MSKKHQYEKDVLVDFMKHLRESDLTLVKSLIPKYYERSQYKGDGETSLIKFHLDIKKVSTKQIEREIKLFLLKNFDV